MLAKLMEYFAKDSDGLLQMVEQFMPDSLRKNLQPSCKRKTRKSIEWISHNFAFRYLFSKELVRSLHCIALHERNKVGFPNDR
ncbi:hypothetical protein V6N13_145083 [Hibiscus sabdariffa]